MGTNVFLSNSYFVMKMSMYIMRDACFIIDSEITVSDLIIPQPKCLEGQKALCWLEFAKFVFNWFTFAPEIKREVLVPICGDYSTETSK